MSRGGNKPLHEKLAGNLGCPGSVSSISARAEAPCR